MTQSKLSLSAIFSDSLWDITAMNFRTALYFLCVQFLTAVIISTATANTTTIGHTPILTATLPTNSTYQVEASTDGTTWTYTGVLIAGSGASSSVRLDGFPANSNYRLSAVGVVNVVTPAISFGVHVGASFPATTEVRIESVNQLGASNWTNRFFAFSNLHTGVVAPLPPPLSSNEFFRAMQPASPLVLGTVSGYPPDTNNTLAGYGLVADDMPSIYRNGFTAAVCPAVYHRGGNNAAAAGECYELVGPQGKTTVMVADTTPSFPQRTCDVGQPYFDIGIPAFTNIFDQDTGFGIATFRLVPAPVTGNIKMVCVLAAGGYYIELRPYNHRAGVSKLEVQTNGGSWIELPRTDYNSFVYNTGTPLEFPFNTRITSRFGEQVTFPPINSLSSGGDRFTANGQFNVFPDMGPEPVWILPPVYTDALTNVLGGDWGASAYGDGIINPKYSGSVYQGSHSLQISGMSGFGGVYFNGPIKFPLKAHSYLEFAIRSEGAAIANLKVQIHGINSSGAASQSAPVTLPTIDSTWRVFRIPLEPANAPDQISHFLLMNSTSSTLPNINLDSIAFR